jgi:hypothetical protein
MKLAKGGEVANWGLKCQSQVWAMTISFLSQIHLNSAPPRPGRAIQILGDTVRSQELSIRLDFGQLSERNGRLIKLALVVAEIEENDGTEGKLREEEEGENGTVSKIELEW